MIQSHCLFHIICIKHYFIAQVVEGVRLHNNDFGFGALVAPGIQTVFRSVCKALDSSAPPAAGGQQGKTLLVG